MIDSAHQLDVRNLPPTDRDTRILNEFESLGDGDAFVLIDGQEPGKILKQIEARHAGGVEWSSLESGPQLYRTEIRRRPDGTRRTVSDYLAFDHDRLDGMLPEVERLVNAGDLAGAAERFAEFSCGLNHHIEAEEQVLFPDFELRTGMRSGPTVVMRAEHVEIRKWMAAASAALQAEDAAGFRDAIERMTDVLTQHNMKEEEILYPMADQARGDQRAQDVLVREMQVLL
jgi:uncharacterized protein (DUF2249 family)/hemerythrin superfamily protein